ncbi:MAG: MotA/TolQ/ExbB proton channel family protein [Syntrophales bacterium]|jgi:biopolymer transport protein ExbB|nr:MotA/TolQ/ExbB proton channel family protein [Syntrophales bacterium]MCK9527478.1 MotA/TolQ/ExbB proton channel family protein [Syntrophales bacterium]MDX9922534.1 MotA/TolQ/ExbB proton channel family protein [Syntrophales bacterium]
MIDYFCRGGPVMYPLLFCSILSLTVIIERALFWIRQGRDSDFAGIENFMACVEKNDLQGARRLAEGSRDPRIRVLVCGMVHREFSLREALQMAAGEEISRMRRYLPVLDTMITLAPLLGILGTVTGIIFSFTILGEAGVNNPAAVTAGIGQALITTAFGLVIAIFSLIPYNYFSDRVEKATDEIEKYATTLEMLVEKNKNGKGDGR